MAMTQRKEDTVLGKMTESDTTKSRFIDPYVLFIRKFITVMDV